MSQKFAHTDAEGFVLGFYAEDIHETIPEGSIEISDETWQALLAGQGKGKRMKVSAEGSPELVDASAEVLAANARSERNALLRDTDWVVTQQQEKSLTGTGGMSDERFKAFSSYRQALRDVPQQKGFPASITWPEKPA